MQINDRVKSGFLKCCPGSEKLQQSKTNIGKISDIKERNPLHANLPVSGVRQSAWYTHTGNPDIRPFTRLLNYKLFCVPDSTHL